jgi:hypothetical protein
VVAGAVGFDNAAVGGLTAAVLLDLALELLQGGAPHAVHPLPGGLGLAVGGASVHGGFRVRARPPGPGVGLAGECRRSRLTATGLCRGAGAGRGR